MSAVSLQTSFLNQRCDTGYVQLSAVPRFVQQMCKILNNLPSTKLMTPPIGTLKKKLNFQAVIKSAASAASQKTKIQDSRGSSLAVSVVHQPSRRLLAPLDSWIWAFREAALAADLITA